MLVETTVGRVLTGPVSVHTCFFLLLILVSQPPVTPMSGHPMTLLTSAGSCTHMVHAPTLGHTGKHIKSCNNFNIHSN